MRTNKSFLIIEIVIIINYLFIFLNSIIIQPINIILGIICVLFLPGYNLLSVIKPDFNLIKKLGYMTIFSFVIENLIMFFSYIFLYDIVTTPENPAFYFNDILLIISIQIFNLILILIEIIKCYKNHDKNFQVKLKLEKNINNKEEKIQYFNKEYERKNFNVRILIVLIIFIFSLILLCLSTSYSFNPNHYYYLYLYEYKSEFLFFYRVPFIFYIFLAISISCLTCIIFISKNHYFILFSISIFLYCLWILPYLQIGNYFNVDSYVLASICKDYQNYGIKADIDNSFLIFLDYRGGFGPYRYPTSIFTGILLTIATGVSVDIALWYLYPLIFIFIPFFFYSIFQEFLKKKEYRGFFLILLTFLAILTPLFLKQAHTATTGVIGAYLYFILIIELFNIIKNREEGKSNRKHILLFIIIYFILCLTHLEECIYLIILIALYNIYYLFFEIKKIDKKHDPRIKDLKKTLYLTGLTLFILLFIFLEVQEFFGYIEQYFYFIIINGTYKENVIYILYENSKIRILNFLRISFDISLFFIVLLILSIVLFVFIFYLLLFKYYSLFFKFFKFCLKILKKIHYFLFEKIFSRKGFQLLIFPLFFGIILIINFLFYQILSEQGLLLIIELLGNYTIFILNIFLFIIGMRYYKIENDKQIFFFLSIVASSSMMAGFFIVGSFELSFYILNAKFFTYFIFFNLIIIQNNYLEKFLNKRKANLILLVILLLVLGSFYSLRNLSYG